MKIICVDDEKLVLDLTVALCKLIVTPDSVINGFRNPMDALAFAEVVHPDIALLDIDMPGMNGIVLAARIKERSPNTSIIFLTGYAQYAVDAFSLHASGYLLKPVNKDRLAEEIDFALAKKNKPKPPVKTDKRISVQTFGNFDLFVDGKTVTFSRSKAKELLAYLIDRQGSGVTRSEVFSVLWEDSNYDRSMQKQLDVVIRSLRTTLEAAGIPELFEMKSGFLRIEPELIDCDLYHFMEGDIDAVNAYRGEYMTSYAWAELTAAYMDRQQHQRI